METNVSVKPGIRIKSFYLFFVVFSLQIGVGIMSVPRDIFAEAKQDAWISVLVAGLIMHLIVFVMFLILRQYDNADILGIQQDIFGLWVGKLIGTFYLIYLYFVALAVIIKYIEVVQVYIFSQISPWMLSFLLVSLIVYAGLGGIRVAIGVTFLFYFMFFWLLFFLYKPASLMDFTQFQPILEATPWDILKGTYQTSFLYIGLEIIFFIYPFIEDKKKAQLPAQLGVGMTTFVIFLLTVISIGYYSDTELQYSIWPVLGLYKVIAYAVIGRFDVLVIIAWMMVILPNLILLAWMISHGLKRLYSLPQQNGIYILSFFLFIGGGISKDHFQINAIANKVAFAGLWILAAYPIFLLTLVWIKKGRS